MHVLKGFLHVVILYQKFLFNTNNFLNKSIWPIDRTLTDTTNDIYGGLQFIKIDWFIDWLIDFNGTSTPQ